MCIIKKLPLHTYAGMKGFFLQPFKTPPMESELIKSMISQTQTSESIKKIASKVLEKQRISENDAIELYKYADFGLLSMLANFIRESKNGDLVYFNRNFHIEPTNICIYNCIFCSYSRKVNQDGAWEFSVDDILKKVNEYKGKQVSEVHIVGGTHPNRTIDYYCEILSKVKEALPTIHIKAFTAVELEFMIKKSNLSIEDGLKKLKAAGLDSIPGGGAEIFDEELRKKICPDKTTSENWLNIHKAAHLIGLPTNATMLYGHLETFEHRVDHMSRLRNLQDQTNGFNAFIPLKFRKENNQLSHLGEVSIIDDLRNYAISRIFLDNIPHLKAYWPMIGKQTTQISLSFGVDDIDGTIDDSTKIYSMAGVEDKSPSMNTEQMVELIKQAKRLPVERDTLYNIIQRF